MHILETYALNCGASISKPSIYTSFFPVPFDKYITFQSDTSFPSKNYDYWQDVLNILSPILAKAGIQILQIGEGKDRNYSNCASVKGLTSYNQTAFLIRNSLLHFGADDFAVHIAGAFDIPLVALYSSTHTNCSKPYFGDPKKQKLIASYEKAGQKPSYSAEENPKTINLIKPEEIAQEVINLLGLDFNVPFETVFCGKKYSSFIIQETIPTSNHILYPVETQVEIRADLGYSQESFIFQIANYKKSVVVLNAPIDIEILKRFRSNIVTIIFIISDASHRPFLEQLQALGKGLIMISYLPQAKIDDLKICYYEFGIIHFMESAAPKEFEALKKDMDRLYYRSIKLSAANQAYYYSHTAIENGVKMTNHHEYQKVIDSPSFWRDIECFTVVRLK